MGTTQVIVSVVAVLACVLAVFVGHALTSRGYNLGKPWRGVRIGPTGRPLPRPDDFDEGPGDEGNRG